MAAPILWTPEKSVRSAGKTMSIKFLVLGGGVFWVWGGGECRFYFYGREDFLREGVKSARGETAIPRRADHTRNMFGTSLHTTYCK